LIIHLKLSSYSIFGYSFSSIRWCGPNSSTCFFWLRLRPPPQSSPLLQSNHLLFDFFLLPHVHTHHIILTDLIYQRFLHSLQSAHHRFPACSFDLLIIMPIYPLFQHVLHNQGTNTHCMGKCIRLTISMEIEFKPRKSARLQSHFISYYWSNQPTANYCFDDYCYHEYLH